MASLQQNWKIGQNRFDLEARGMRGRERVGGRGDKMAQCMHI
jgi:hypothetical protein